MDVLNPLHNIREFCKHAILLEDHLIREKKRCEDCVMKHLLALEAFTEEALHLCSPYSGLRQALEKLLERVYDLQVHWANQGDPIVLAASVRELRKPLMPLGNLTLKTTQEPCSCRGEIS